MGFKSREEAGQKLGAYLRAQNIPADIVLGLPRGGVVVAHEVALTLNLPLDVVVVRKIGHPRHREFAVGALAEGEVVLLDQEAIGRTHVRQDELQRVITDEKERLLNYQQKFGRVEPLDLAGKGVWIVDDGLATGATTEAAVLSARNRHASRVFVAVPVASTSACERLQSVADGVHALIVDPQFDAVGRYYNEFEQTTDEEVIQLLEQRTAGK